MLLWKLLRKNISVPQLAGYGIAALFGMGIVLLAFLFYHDTRPLFSSENSLFKSDFIVVSKKVSLLTNIRSNRSAFSQKEMDDIRQQPFVKNISNFTPANYQVYAHIGSSGNVPGFSTYMFFESVPDHILDVTPEDWKWDESSRFIPVIIPRNYLNLYNFGFAQSQGLPQLSENIIGEVTLGVILSGKGHRESFTSRIVGFTDRINTILVPEDFMRWSNARFGDETATKISRLIIEVNNPADPAIAEYFAGQNLDINDDKGEQGKISYFLKILVFSVSAVGVVIMFLAIALMLISINLLVYKNQKTFENLRLQGYTHFQLCKPYYILTFLINVLVFIGALVISLVFRNMYLNKLVILQNDDSASIGFVVFIGIIIALCITLLNNVWIAYKIASIKSPRRK